MQRRNNSMPASSSVLQSMVGSPHRGAMATPESHSLISSPISIQSFRGSRRRQEAPRYWRSSEERHSKLTHSEMPPDRVLSDPQLGGEKKQGPRGDRRDNRKERKSK